MRTVKIKLSTYSNLHSPSPAVIISELLPLHKVHALFILSLLLRCCAILLLQLLLLQLAACGAHFCVQLSISHDAIHQQPLWADTMLQLLCI